MRCRQRQMTVSRLSDNNLRNMAKKEQTIVEELANAPREGEHAFGEPEKETPTVPPAEETKKEIVEEPKKPEENLPFHKHPDWIKRERKLDERLAAIEARHQEELEALRKSIPQQQTVRPAPQWFVNIYGDNPEAWKEYSSYDDERRKEIKEELRREIQEENKKSSREQQEIEKSIDNSIAELKEEGNEFDENELLRIAVKYQPSNEKGEIDLHKALEIYNDFKANAPQSAAPTNAKKELAAASIKRTPEASKKEFSTPKDFKGKNWRDLLN
jgi:hypothetical protein